MGKQTKSCTHGQGVIQWHANAISTVGFNYDILCLKHWPTRHDLKRGICGRFIPFHKSTLVLSFICTYYAPNLPVRTCVQPPEWCKTYPPSCYSRPPGSRAQSPGLQCCSGEGGLYSPGTGPLWILQLSKDGGHVRMLASNSCWRDLYLRMFMHRTLLPSVLHLNALTLRAPPTLFSTTSQSPSTA